MQDISFVISPIRDHALFKKPQFQGLIGDNSFSLRASRRKAVT
jgi:hypothetical protein